MLDLTPETEALARRLAEASRLSVDAGVREALEARGETDPEAVDVSRDDIGARSAAVAAIIARVRALPDVDPRSTQEIVDDLNAI